MTRPEVVSGVEQQLGSSVSPSAVSTSIDPNSYVININASSRSSARAAAIANAFAKVDASLTTSEVRKQYEQVMSKLKSVKPWIVRELEQPLGAGAYPQSMNQVDNYRQFSQCINCMLCYAACPVYGMENEFLGPAAIALARRYNNDSRDEGSAERVQVPAWIIGEIRGGPAKKSSGSVATVRFEER